MTGQVTNLLLPFFISVRHFAYVMPAEQRFSTDQSHAIVEVNGRGEIE
jgi:hypothetical protein